MNYTCDINRYRFELFVNIFFDYRFIGRPFGRMRARLIADLVLIDYLPEQCL